MRCHLCPKNETKVRKKTKVACMRLGLPPPQPGTYKGTEISDLPAFVPLPFGSALISDTDAEGGSTVCTDSASAQEFASGLSSEADTSGGSEMLDEGKKESLAPPPGIVQTKEDLDEDVVQNEGEGAAIAPASILQRRGQRALTEPVNLHWIASNILSEADAEEDDRVEDGKMPGPSIGSASHGTGGCRPCAWYWKPDGCQNGENCMHCHMCPAGEIKTRKKARLASLRLSAALP